MPSAQAETKLPEAAGVRLRIEGGHYSLSLQDAARLTGASHVQSTEGGAILFGGAALSEGEQYYMEEYSADGACAVTELAHTDNSLLSAFYKNGGDVYYAELLFEEQDSGETWRLFRNGQPMVLDGVTADDAAVNDLFVSGGKILLAADTRLLCLSEDGALLWQTPFPRGAFLQTRDGRLLVRSDTDFSQIDLETGDLTPAGKLPSLFRDDGAVYSGENASYDCLIVSGDALYGWNVGADEAVQILSFYTVGLSAPLISTLACLAPDTYIGTTYRHGEGDRLFCISPESETAPEKKTLRIAASGSFMAISAAVADFHTMHPEYEVQMIDLQQTYGDELQTKLNLDLLYDDCPDLLFVNGLPTEAYERQGILEDLYGFIDEDETVCREDFLPNLLQTLETEDGRLCRLPLTWSIVTAAALTKTAAERESLAFSDLPALAAQSENFVSVFWAEPAQQLAQTLLFHAPAAFVDYENAQANFDAPDFLDFLRFLINAKQAETKEYASDFPAQALLNGEILLDGLTISNPDAFAQAEEGYHGEAVYIGYPGASGSAFYLNSPMAIPVRAQEKDAAWQFIRMLVGSEYYAMGRGWLPTVCSFEDSLAQAVSAGMEESCAEKLRSLQSGICSAVYYDEAVLRIVQEELPYYLDGVRTEEETAKIIDSRVQLYLDELFS